MLHLRKVAQFSMATGEVDEEGRLPIIPVENVALGLLPGQEHAFAYESSKRPCEHCI